MRELRRRSYPFVIGLTAVAVSGFTQLGGPVAASAAQRAVAPPAVVAAAAPAVVTVGACPTGTRPGRAASRWRSRAPARSTPVRGSCRRELRSARTSGWSTRTARATPARQRARSLDKCLPSRAPGGSTKPATTAAGDPTEPYADTCPWPSVRTTSGHAKIVAQGDETDLSAVTRLRGLAARQVPHLGDVPRLQDRRGALHRGRRSRAPPVTVEHAAAPLPLGTIKIQVFNDNVPVDGTYEVDAEQGLRRVHRQPHRRPRTR